MSKNYLPIITPVILFLVGLGFLGYTYYKNVSNKPAALSVTSKYKSANVSVRGESYGESPVEIEEIKPGRAEVKVSGEKNEVTKDVFLLENALTVLSVDTGVSSDFSASMNLWYDKNTSSEAELFVNSNPTGAKVTINGNEVGETPLTLSEKEILDNDSLEYTILIEKEGFEAQNVPVRLQKGYTLSISSDLFLKPIPKEVNVFTEESNYKMYGFKASDLAKNPNGEWASALAYWLNTRGTAVFEGQNVEYFDYFIDSEGTLYTGNGDLASKETEKAGDREEQIYIGYLNTESDSQLTNEANSTLQGLFGLEATDGQNTTYQVTETGVGYLNVRASADLNGDLLGKLNVGDTVNVIEQQGDWYKINFEGEDGFVYSTYLQLVEQQEEQEEEAEETQ